MHEKMTAPRWKTWGIALLGFALLGMTILYFQKAGEIQALSQLADLPGQESSTARSTVEQVEIALQTLKDDNAQLQKQVEEKNKTIEDMAKHVDEISKAYQQMLDTIHSARPEQTLESLQNAIENAGGKPGAKSK